MKVFLVERDMLGISLDGLGEAKDAANRQVTIMRAEGTEVRYLRTTFVPGDGRCMCLFEAEDEAVVRTLNDDAGLPYHRVIEAYDLTPQGALHGA